MRDWKKWLLVYANKSVCVRQVRESSPKVGWCCTPCPLWSRLVQLSVTDTPGAMSHTLPLESSPRMVIRLQASPGSVARGGQNRLKPCAKVCLVASLLSADFRAAETMLVPRVELYLTFSLSSFFFLSHSLLFFWFSLLGIWVIWCFMG